jgi:two-component system nitrate/nitrite response regulator NarL
MTAQTRILVVDDHPIVLDGVSALASRVPGIAVAGYARNGRDAIVQAVALQPDVVLLDLRLPDMLGSEVARELRSRLPQARIIVFTAFPNHAGVAAALASGADEIVVKDASRTDLVDAIRHVAEGRGRRSDDTKTQQETQTKQARCGLTRREYDVLRRLAMGETNAEIASALELSPNTVKTYVQIMLQKLGARNRVEAISRAAELGLL